MGDYYDNDADFFSLFEADTFDVEEYENGDYRGYIYNEAGEKVLAGMFNYSGEMSGVGWYDDTLI